MWLFILIKIYNVCHDRWHPLSLPLKASAIQGLDTSGQVICSAFYSFDIVDLSKMVKSSNKFFNKINKLVNKIKLTNTVSEVIMRLPEIQVLKLNQH